MRTVERLAVVADGFAEAGAAQIEHDRRKADVLARIDRRIAELAREFAARAGPAAAGRPRADPDPQRPVRVWADRRHG